MITIALRLLIWCLLSADLGTTNVAIGLAVALALPQARHSRHLPLRQLFRLLLACLVAIPVAYAEAVRLLLRGPRLEGRQEASPVTARGSALLTFLEVFRITLTPLTIALGVERGGRAYRIHRMGRPLPPGEGASGTELP
ncbi:Na+/H+ antiporter subunit E [Cyanobium sp. PCC 7001]|uniref:Na+/H+ antiporter subunit E n=1 Tax=Cyanobium sp. PCC 7001 TaxID=180281 RepID=UPI0005B9DF60|nr:Na+/H+ antiporter subunit E [Cyanobium sp. PCC 7001]